MRTEVRTAADAQSAPEVLPWRRADWPEQATARMDAQLAHVGLRRTGPVQEVKNWALSAVLTCCTPAGRIYYKRTLPFLAHEGPLLAHLGERYRGFVPAVVVDGAPEPDWCTHDALVMSGSALPAPDRGAALLRLALLQRDLLGDTGRLRALGCWDRDALSLARRVPELALRGDLLAPAPGRPHTLAHEEWARWADALARLPALCAELASAPPGNTLVHGDLHPGNWGVDLVTGRIVLLDWAEAAVGHPFLDLAPALRSESAALAGARARARCFEGWQPLLSPDECEAVWRLAEPVAALSQLLTYVRFHDETAEPERRGWAPRVLWWARRLLTLLEPGGHGPP
ncbi:phosphotransferase family protein [Streptomyces sp. NPDC054863]